MSNPYKHVGNIAPYYDDFDPDKNYVKILYNPGYALQARELTTGQSMINHQVSALAGSLYKDGTPIDGAKISYTISQPCLRINASFDGESIVYNKNNDCLLDEFVGVRFTGNTSKQMIEVTGYKILDEDTINPKYYLLFSYMGSTLEEGEIFSSYNNAVTLKFKAYGKAENAIVANCSEGSIFIDGYFITVPKPDRNIIVAMPADLETEYHVGFSITRDIIDATQDTTLNDPANGSYNYKAPGADRYKLSAHLAAFTADEIAEKFSDNDNIDFIDGIVFRGATLIKEQNYDNNSALMDILARRTYEESGSYTVKPWKVQLKDCLQEDLEKNGITNRTPDEFYKISIEPGIGYIYGYRVSTLVSQELIVEKPRTWKMNSESTVYIPEGIYTYGKYEQDSNNSLYNRLALQSRFFPEFLTMEEVYVMTTTGENATTASENDIIGTCKVVDVYKTGTIFKIYLSETANVLARFPSARSIVSKNDFDKKVVNPKYINLYTNSDNCAVIFGNDNPKIVPTGYSMVTPAVSSADSSSLVNPLNGSINYQFVKEYTSIASETTKKSITFNTNNDGFSFEKTGLLYVYEVQSGKHIDITNMQVSVSSNTVRIEDINETEEPFEVNKSYRVCGRVTIYNSNIRQKVIKDNIKNAEVIQVNKGTDVVKLAKEDVIEILSVMCDGYEYKDKLVFDNGQRDYVYDYASLSGFTNLEEISSNASNKFTITYRYYDHGTEPGPFSAGSYVNNTNKTYQSTNSDFAERYPDLYSAIPIYRSPETNVRYSLRDCLDFRRKVSELSINGLSYIPSCQTKLQYTVGTYLPRIDRVWVDKNGEFGVTTGIPAAAPEAPEEKDGTMTIYLLFNEPYVFSTNNVDTQYINNQRYTMSDINTLENRIYNMENVVALNMLEQSAINMQITDAEGLNRYKTGIFTDNFSSFDNCDYTNDDWNCTIDAIECSVRPLFNCEEIPFKLVSNTENSLTNNVSKNDDVILTINPNGREVFAQNKELSEATNIQSLMFYVWTGSLQLSPSVDTWVHDLGEKVVSTTYVETPKPPTTYRTWSVITSANAYTTSSSRVTSNQTVTTHSEALDRWGSYWKYVNNYQTVATTTNTYLTTNTTTTTETTSYVGSWSASDAKTKMESQDTYMRSKDVTYKLTGMRPGMQITGTMDGVKLKISNNIIDKDGNCTGTFTIPEKTFTCGTKLVEFYDSANTSAADAQYTANGKTVWTNVDRTYIRTWTAVVSTSSKNSSSTKLVGSTTTSKTTDTLVSRTYVNLDPIAESFYVDSENGVMLESIDLYFAKKDPNVNVEVFIVECENGYPGQVMVPFSRVSKRPSEVIVTDISQIKKNVYPTATNFKFPSPIYLAPNTEYAFVVIAASYNYEIYTSTLGKASLSSGIGIQEQPYIGSMFKSQNLRTWSAEQLSDITFKLYKYTFTKTNGSAIFDIDPSLDFDDVAMMTLAINSFVPNKTNIEYYYKWRSESSWTQFVNKEDIFITAPRNIEEKPENGVSLQMRMTLTTEDTNISPMIDLEQVYGIFTNNILETSDDEMSVYKCGTYISNPITLESESNELRIILDAIIPNDSKIKVYFKTSAYKPTYVEQGSSGTFISGNCVENNIGNTMQVYYYNNSTNSFELPTDSYQSMAIITGYNSKLKRVYMRSVSNSNDFYDWEDNAYIKLNNTNYTMIALLPIVGLDPIYCPTWIARSYQKGDYVLYDGYMWKALMNTTQYNTPSDVSIVWERIDGIQTASVVKEEDEEVVWRPMKRTVNEISSAAANSFTEYTYVPEIDIETEFTGFSIKIDMYSQDKLNVPRFRNLRAIAVI